MDDSASFPIISAGRYPAELLDLCQQWGIAPGALLSWSVRKDGVSMVLPSGRKVCAALRGGWQEAEPGGGTGASRGARKGIR